MMAIVETYKEIEINVDSVKLKGNLRFAENSKGIIIFSHGSGSSRLSIRNNYVAGLLMKNGFSSLLFDLLTVKEDLIYENRFNIELLTDRLVKVTKWVKKQPDIKNFSIGYFGASTGAASALCAAAKVGEDVKAVVSRGGRPDLAINDLWNVKSPILLLVGGNDEPVIVLNNQAKKEINTICELKIIEGASHLFSEAGKLDEVAKQSINWFNKYLI